MSHLLGVLLFLASVNAAYLCWDRGFQYMDDCKRLRSWLAIVTGFVMIVWAAFSILLAMEGVVIRHV